MPGQGHVWAGCGPDALQTEMRSGLRGCDEHASVCVCVGGCGSHQDKWDGKNKKGEEETKVEE